jgi:hypothetical protein
VLRGGKTKWPTDPSFYYLHLKNYISRISLVASMWFGKNDRPGLEYKSSSHKVCTIDASAYIDWHQRGIWGARVTYIRWTTWVRLSWESHLHRTKLWLLQSTTAHTMQFICIQEWHGILVLMPCIVGTFLYVSTTRVPLKPLRHLQHSSHILPNNLSAFWKWYTCEVMHMSLIQFSCWEPKPVRSEAKSLRMHFYTEMCFVNEHTTTNW